MTNRVSKLLGRTVDEVFLFAVGLSETCSNVSISRLVGEDSQLVSGNASSILDLPKKQQMIRDFNSYSECQFLDPKEREKKVCLLVFIMFL